MVAGGTQNPPRPRPPPPLSLLTPGQPSTSRSTLASSSSFTSDSPLAVASGYAFMVEPEAVARIVRGDGLDPVPSYGSPGAPIPPLRRSKCGGSVGAVWVVSLRGGVHTAYQNAARTAPRARRGEQDVQGEGSEREHEDWWAAILPPDPEGLRHLPRDERGERRRADADRGGGSPGGRERPPLPQDLRRALRGARWRAGGAGGQGHGDPALRREGGRPEEHAAPF